MDINQELRCSDARQSWKLFVILQYRHGAEEVLQPRLPCQASRAGTFDPE